MDRDEALQAGRTLRTFLSNMVEVDNGKRYFTVAFAGDLKNGTPKATIVDKANRLFFKEGAGGIFKYCLVHHTNHDIKALSVDGALRLIAEADAADGKKTGGVAGIRRDALRELSVTMNAVVDEYDLAHPRVARRTKKSSSPVGKVLVAGVTLFTALVITLFTGVSTRQRVPEDDPGFDPLLEHRENNWTDKTEQDLIAEALEAYNASISSYNMAPENKDALVEAVGRYIEYVSAYTAEQKGRVAADTAEYAALNDIAGPMGILSAAVSAEGADVGSMRTIADWVNGMLSGYHQQGYLEGIPPFFSVGGVAFAYGQDVLLSWVPSSQNPARNGQNEFVLI